MTATATAQEPLELSCGDYTTNNPLQAAILSVVDAIIEQDSRGAWTRVVTKRIAIDSIYTEAEVEREIKRMLKSDRLYESYYEILFGTFPMTYIRNSSELLEGDR